jgi:hypothetical protein
MCERYIIKDRWIVDTKLNKKIHSIDCYEEKSILDIMNSQDQRIAKLEEQLKNAIRFKTPQIERFAVVQYIHRKGKPYKIEHCYDTYKDENMNTVYCYYDCDSYNFHVIQICDTKAEAQAKLEELKG